MGAYLLALFLTLVIELAVALILGYRSRRELAVVVLVNFVTHPVLHLILFLNNYLAFLTVNDLTIGIMEICIVFVEWGILCYSFPAKKWKLLLLSFLMNLCSYGLGRVIFG
jgi:hypothetical protein